MIKKLLITVIISMTLLVIVLIWALKPYDYNEIVRVSEQKMTLTKELNINYTTMIVGSYNKTPINITGLAIYQKNNTKINWEHNLTITKNTIYNLTPEELILLLKTKLNNTGRYLTFDKIRDCYLIENIIEGELNKELLIDEKYYAKIMTCLNKTNGYPIYYTLLISGLTNIVVNYNSIRYITPEPKIFNETTTT